MGSRKPGRASSAVELLRAFERENVLTGAWHFVPAAGLVLAAFIARWLLDPFLGSRNPLLFFALATFVAAWRGGGWPGIAAGLAGLLVADYFFIEPRGGLLPIPKTEWAGMVGYVCVTSTAVALLEALRRSQERAERAMRLAESQAELLRRGREEVKQLNAELDRRVRERTAELESVNRELEAFSHSVSHDLRAPLRRIIGFSEAVLDDYREKLDERGVKYLQLAVESGRHMGALIEDLMRLSRVTNAELHPQEVDLSGLATRVVDELRKQEPQRAVEVTITPKLVAQGDEGLVRIALENLVRNAWKFTAQQTSGKIELGGTLDNGVLRCFLRDNGVGFDMKQARRLFGVFQRLHSAQAFPGTGVGLATVKRIFNRLGGQVWAEGKVNQGATFYFTLPQSMAHTGA